MSGCWAFRVILGSQFVLTVLQHTLAVKHWCELVASLDPPQALLCIIVVVPSAIQERLSHLSELLSLQGFGKYIYAHLISGTIFQVDFSRIIIILIKKCVALIWFVCFDDEMHPFFSMDSALTLSW
jgi:hypothetical protein